MNHFGNISSPETWHKADSPHIVTADVYLYAILTIEAGSEIRFNTSADIRNRAGGKILAVGTKGDLIDFTDSGQAVPGKIQISTSYGTGSEIKYCKFNNCSYGAILPVTAPSWITVKNCIFIGGDNATQGVYMGDQSTTIDHCVFDGFTDVAVKGSSGSARTFNVKNSIFINNNKALERVGASATLNSQYNNFYNNTIDYSGTISDKIGDELARDPGFLGGSPYSYRLTAISPCISDGESGSNMGLEDYTVTVTSSFTIISTLLKNIISSFTIVSHIFQPSFKLTSNLLKSISSNFTIISSLLKVETSSFKIISYLRKVIISGFRDYLDWQCCGSLTKCKCVDGYKTISGPTILKKVWLYCDNTGSSGSTIIDINKNDISVFDNPSDRPELMYDDANKLVEAIIPDVKAESGDKISVDIDEIAPGSKDLSVTAVLEQFTGLHPQVDYIELLDDQYLINREVAYYSSKFKIRIKFDQTMKSATNLILDILPLGGQDKPTISGTGSWESIYQPNDTYVTPEINLDGDNIGKFELVISNAESLFGTAMLSEISKFEIINRKLIYIELPYSENKDVEVILNAIGANYVSFSLDGSNWCSWLTYENKKNVDITDAGMGGNSGEEVKNIYVKFKDGIDNITDGSDSINITYVITSLTFTDCTLTQQEHHDRAYHGETYRLKYKLPVISDLIPVKTTNIYIDDDLTYIYTKEFTILEGFKIDWSTEQLTWSPPNPMPGFTIENGKYLDDDGFTRTLLSQIITLDDPVADDRIDVVYINKNTHAIEILKGTEGKTEDSLIYEGTNIAPLLSDGPYPALPFIEQYMQPLYYIYVSLAVKYYDSDPATLAWIIKYSILPYYCYKSFKYDTEYIVKDLFLLEGEHSIKVEVVDELGRTANKIFPITVTNITKLGRLRAYTSPSKATEIITGEFSSYNGSIWLELEDYS